MSLDQAARALHLEEGVLLALEEERFTALGAPVFVRGHLRSYARLLGLAEEAVLEAYRIADPASDAVPRVARDREKPLATSPGPVAVGIGVAVLVLAIVAWLVGSQSGEPVAPPTLPPAGEAVPVGANDPATPPVVSVGTDAVAGPVSAAGTLRVELGFEQSSWVQVDAADGRLADGEQLAGSTRVVDAVPPVDIILGNAPGVRVRVNGEPWEIPASARSAGSNVARFRIDAPVPAPPAASPSPPAPAESGGGL
jgi:cytoskeleton protein RodZ